MGAAVMVLSLLAIAGGIGSLCRPVPAPPKLRASYYVAGVETMRDILKALRIDRPVRALTLHCRYNSAVTIELEYLAEKADADALVEVLALYRAEPVREKV